MAISVADCQAQLGSSPMDARIIRGGIVVGTLQEWYVIGNVDAPGRARWIRTTAADNAATQAADILTALRAT